MSPPGGRGRVLPILFAMPQARHRERTVDAAGNLLRFGHMQRWMKLYEQHDRTALAYFGSQPTLASNGVASHFLEGEQQEWIANSKLDRLAEELRALGIQF